VSPRTRQGGPERLRRNRHQNVTKIFIDLSDGKVWNQGQLIPKAPVASRNTIAGKGRRSANIRRICIAVGFGVSIIGLAFLLDDTAARFLQLQSNHLPRRFAGWASRLGEGWVIATVGLLLTAWFWMRRRVDAARLVFLVSTVALLTGATATVMRSLIGRTRPNAHVPQGIYGVWHNSHWIIGQYQFGAFPSGHAATVVGLAAAVWVINRKWGIAAAFYAALVSWSRLAKGSHHFSDVVASAVLGILCAPSFVMIIGPWLNRFFPTRPNPCVSLESQVCAAQILAPAVPPPQANHSTPASPLSMASDSCLTSNSL